MGEVPSTDASRNAPDKCSLRRYRSAKVARSEAFRRSGRWTVSCLQAGIAAYGAIVPSNEPLAAARMVPSQGTWLRAHVPRRPWPVAPGEEWRHAQSGVQRAGVHLGLRRLSRSDHLAGGTATSESKMGACGSICPTRARKTRNGKATAGRGRFRGSMVRMIGLEPTLPRGNWNLNPARLPISPHPRALKEL